VSWRAVWHLQHAAASGGAGQRARLFDQRCRRTRCQHCQCQHDRQGARCGH
ncbi:hypothetical protein BN1723_020041, partial [Verticillium longisporum]